MKSNRFPSVVSFAAVTFVILGIMFFIWLRYCSSVIVIGAPKMDWQRDPAWSPDGKLLAFECHYSYPSDGYDQDSWNNPMWSEETGEICIFNIETREFERLTYGRHKLHPSWSSDGTQLLWLDVGNGLVVYNLKTQTGKILEYDSEQDNHPFYSDPDGYISPNKHFQVQLSDYQEPYAGYYFSIMENNMEIFESDFKVYPDPVWNPDGSILAVKKSGDSDTVQEISFLHLPDKEIVNINFSHHINDISWSPNGTTIAFQTDEILEVVDFQFKTNPFSYQVREQRTFHLHGIVDKDISWSPDGRYITFLSSDIIKRLDKETYIGTPDKIWLLDLVNNTQTPLISH